MKSAGSPHRAASRPKVTFRPAVTSSTPVFAYDLITGHQVSVIASPDACRALIQHCSESNIHGREVGGILAGYRDTRIAGDGRTLYRVVLTDVIALPCEDSSPCHLTFDSRCWAVVQKEMMPLAAEGKCRLGWYHTHPTQGIFFSDHDRDAHHIFREPHQFALVVNPRTMEAGVFHWTGQPGAIEGPICFPLEKPAPVGPVAGLERRSRVRFLSFSRPRQVSKDAASDRSD